MSDIKENLSDDLMTYCAKEVKTGKIIAEGKDFLLVDKIARSSGLVYMIKFVPNPNLKFVF